jgi:hypothetical protein
VIINGAMQVAQRGTSTASITAGGYYTADRWFLSIGSLGTWTQSVESDAPTGSGLRKSLKMLCTTADASPSANDYMVMETKLEGQNVQQFAKGTTSAKQFAVSFWVKSNVTGTYVVELYDTDSNRSVSASYSVPASATWEKKTLIFPADSSNPFDNDNGGSLTIGFWLGAGTTFTSGTLATTWGASTSANRAPGVTNLAAATNNYWQVTGVQLEAGAVATPFEFEEYGTTLRKCERYFQVVGQWATYWSTATTTCAGGVIFPTRFRTTPVLVSGSQSAIMRYGPGGQRSTTLVSFQDIYDTSAYCIITDNGGTPFTTNYPVVCAVGAQFSAEM